MTNFADLFATVSNDEKVQSLALALGQQTEALAVASELPRLMIAARAVERIPEQYERIETLFRERAKAQAYLADESPYSGLFAAIAPHFKEFSFVENRELIGRSPEVRPWLDALNVPQEKQDQLWRFIDASLPDVVRDLAERGKTNLTRYFDADVPFAATAEEDWQRLSPWNWVRFIGDVFVAGSIILGGVGGLLVVASTPIGWGFIVGAGMVYLAGECVKNAFEKQEAERP